MSVSGCKVGFCLKQEMHKAEKNAKPCKNKDEMYLSKKIDVFLLTIAVNVKIA